MENNIIKLIRNKDIEGVRKAIEEGVDVNIQNKDGYTALMIASERGYFEIVKLLIEKKAKLDIQNEYGCTALKFASIYNWIDIAEFLIEKKAKLDIQNEYGWTLLMEAIYYGRRNKLIKSLLKGGADKDIKNNEGETALDFAKARGNQEIVELLTTKNYNNEK